MTTEDERAAFFTVMERANRVGALLPERIEHIDIDDPVVLAELRVVMAEFNATCGALLGFKKPSSTGCRSLFGGRFYNSFFGISKVEHDHHRYRSGRFAQFISANAFASFSGPHLALNASHSALKRCFATSNVVASPNGALGMAGVTFQSQTAGGRSWASRIPPISWPSPNTMKSSGRIARRRSMSILMQVYVWKHRLRRSSQHIE
ncbi:MULTISPECIES: hypothetical protein [unclassified Bradyrhizobium]|jgi:hypothetical protein|uniref:hypothetical protein n=1 Tax=unclassified Bradyrhizobium TaxID=2631580 RepID=UPI0012FA63A8|nr:MULTISPECIES: hypothetical protein [unclassified Bradyrhizobium]MCK1321437.1 hypothetical protein [Bradyrhizobium sp. 156]MCK1351863.1 hypothetical protein [Bradyrhizobium sp. CW7]MCK1468810.1 hypothetical protein [Bradyrhizobium sp. CW10]MCK1483754.1 hypothetical protein [Bradyrhizobium sp. 193]MCK1495600.1 hypothetical protein [Bradyrhizobium sp. 188]